MDLYRVEHAFTGKSGLPKDSMVNVFHFNWIAAGPPDESNWTALDLQVRGFYNQTFTPSLFPLSHFMSDDLVGQTETVKIYALSYVPGPPARIVAGSPVYETTGLTGDTFGGDDTLPYEVAFCLSYHALPIPGIPNGRFRGRIFLGPLALNCLGASGRPAPELGSACLNGAQGLNSGANALGWQWCIYSPTQSVVEAVPWGNGMMSFSIDDAWDTQRRRGNDPTGIITSPV